jgi:pimeloyl-ACP methyl ester carboxylesterase
VVNAAGASLRYEPIGSGVAVLILHGAYSARVELRTALEPTFIGHHGYRRLYLDLPGMGDSPAHESIVSSADVLDVIDELIATEIGALPFAVIGHSYGAHLARGIAARHPRQALGIALICALIPDAMTPEPHEIVHTEGDPYEILDLAHVDEYRSYFVSHTPESAQRFNDAVAPALGKFDAAAVARVMERWEIPLDPDGAPFDGEALILTGRHDSTVGFREQFRLIDSYPRATYIVASGAGHALPHERPDLVVTVLGDWLRRLRTDAGTEKR